MVLPLLQPQLDLDVVPDPQFANSRLYRRPFGAVLITLTLPTYDTTSDTRHICALLDAGDCARSPSLVER